MALNILSVSPADGAINWPLNTDLTITFDANVVKGQGSIHVIRDSTNSLGVAVDVNSPNVTISGSTVTVDLPTDLLAVEAYHVFIDNGAFLDTSSTPTNAASLLTQNFDLLALNPFPVGVNGGDGTDFTLTPPLNYSVDNTQMASGGLAPYVGWSIMDKNSWIGQAGDQARSSFTKGSGAVALGDPDQFDDATNGGPFNSKFITRTIKLKDVADSWAVAENSVVLEFDSSFRPEDAQIGLLDVRFDGADDWVNLLTLNPTNTSNDDPGELGDAPLPPIPAVPVNLNERLVSGVNTGVSTGGNDRGKGNAPFRSVQNPAGASTMELRWGVQGKNTWWWAIDNLKVTGDINKVPFLGINDATTWNLDIPRLTVAIDNASMSENGGTATGTVTRNGAASNWTTPLVVTLESNDTSEATVPATVTIPATQASVTFPITAVNDSLSDRTQTALITASATTFASGSKSINVLDDEGPKVVSLSPADNATGVDYKSNLVITANVPLKKGNGLIHIVRTTGNVVVASLNVNSPEVTVAGSVVTIDPPVNLNGLTDYYILVDDGAFIDATLPSTPSAAILLQQSFAFTAPGTTPPTGFTVAGGGWNFVDKSTFVSTTGNSSFAGTGTVAVTTVQDSFLRTTPIDLTGVTGGSVVLEFDATYSGSVPKFGAIQVSTDGGTSWIDIAQLDSSVGNTHVVINSTGVTGATPLGAPFSNPTTGSMMFQFGQIFSSGGYFALDNFKITGEVQGLPFQGFQAPNEWNFTTAVAPTLTVTIDKTSMSENGGTATGTVTSNVAVTAPLTVTLASSDATEASVPASVVIPIGSAGTSATFTITAVDDLLGDGTQTATISASVVDYFSVPASIGVTDDDFPKTTTFSPADNATAVPVGANLVVTFDQNVKKGNGFVHIIRTSDGKSAQSIDVQSSLVTISGAVVTINPSQDLLGLTNYYLSFEEGTILSATNAVKTGATLLSQDFELMTLSPAVFETAGRTPDGKDFTATPPTGYSVDNSLMPPGGVPEWNGWTFANKGFWATQGGQSRASFTLGNNTIAVGDNDEWDDTVTLNNSFNSLFLTSPINLADVVAGTAVLDFDSSFRPEDGQIGKLDVTYDGGTTWSNLITLDPNSAAANINEHKTFPLLDQPNSGSMQFRWQVTGNNNWWWAIDNIKVIGNTNGLSYPGIANTDATTWNFTTAEASTLNVSVAPATMAENGGTAVVTVTRNLGTAGDLTVNLTSSDPASATVPASVTILAGQASATFTVTAVDDSVADGLKNVTITASTTGFVSGTSIVPVTDNEVADVIISEFMYSPGLFKYVSGNPTSFNNATKAEWIEVVNRGTVAADLSKWSIDDEDLTNWGTIAPGTILAPGQVGVLYNQAVSGVSPADFRTAWNVPSTAVVVGMFWGDLGDSPAATGTLNENILLRDSANATIDQANYDDDGVIWPANVAGSSIYLKSISADNNIGTNWGSSVVGTDGAVNPIQIGTPAATVYALTDKGSPGVVPASNLNPVVSANSAAVSGNEGATVTNTGTWSDPDAGNVVTLTASAGTIVKNANGTWDWSIASTDQVAATTVTITADDGVGGTASTTFTYTVNNVAPVLTRSLATVTGNVLSVISNSGTYSDVASDTVTLSVDVGTIVNNNNGTWTWSVTPSAVIVNQTVTVTAVDEDGGSSTVTFTLNATAAVVNSKVYYKGSSFSQGGTNVNAALDTGKSLAKSGSTPVALSYSNLTNSTRGINGLVFDVAGATNVTASDLAFRMSPTGLFNEAANQPNTWSAPVPTPTAIVFTPGTATTPARVRVEWADNDIRNRWLQIRILPTSNTKLTVQDTYYIGHLQGEVNGQLLGGGYFVQNSDLNAVLPVSVSALVTSNRDIDKSGFILNADLIAVRAAVNGGFSLRNITIPAAGSIGEGEGSVMAPMFSALAASSTPSTELARIQEPSIGPRWTGLDYSVPQADEVAKPKSTVSVYGPVAASENEVDESVGVLAPIDDYFAELGKKKAKF